MFGIDFPELVVIAVVALIVIGPEHLPKVARTIGHLWGRAQKYVNGVKADISRDMALDELRKAQQQAQQEVGNIENSIQQASAQIMSEGEAAKNDVTRNDALNEATPSHEIIRHEIIEEHHAVMPASIEHKNTTHT